MMMRMRARGPGSAHERRGGFADADFTEADLDGTVFTGARRLDIAEGIDKAANRDRAVY